MAKIFISSTVYDLRDIRSAIDFHLTELGHEVYLSELPSFNPANGKSSYDACFKKIESCDLFVLLIGSRVGGLFPSIDPISITRAEYRHAYELSQSGRIEIITLARKEILDVLEDRSAVARYLTREYDIPPDAAAEADSKILRDAQHIKDFIDEVGRKDEMKEAAATMGKVQLPVNNWIAPFASYRDVISTITRRLQGGTPVSSIFLKQNLLRELHNNIRAMSSNHEGKVMPIDHFPSPFLRAYKLNATDPIITVNGRHFRWFIMGIAYVGAINRCSHLWMERARTHRPFFDEKNNNKPSSIVEMAERLISLHTCAQSHLAKINIGETFEKYKVPMKAEGNVQINSIEISVIYTAISCVARYYNGSLAFARYLHRYVDTIDLASAELPSIFVDQKPLLSSEAASDEQIAEYIRSPRPG
jgi:hypothetical protein